MRMMRFNPSVRHVPGKELVVADALSRRPLPHKREDEEKIDEMVEYIDSVKAAWPTSSSFLQKMKLATARDPMLQKVATFIAEGWPQPQSSISLPVIPYYHARDELSMFEGLITYGSHIVVPEQYKEEVLGRLHETHQGKGKCRERAQSAVWWPGIGKDINALIERCSRCMEAAPAQ